MQKKGPSFSTGQLSFPPPRILTEELLQFIWQFGYFNKSALTTHVGEEVAVVFAGSLNKNQGPDFTAAKIRIGNTLLAGTVELHLKTSDWKKHNHEEDQQYKNVILHVVFEHDCEVNAIPVLELRSRISTLLLDRYASFMESVSFIACSNSIAEVKALTLTAWKERLLAERLTRKSRHIFGLLQQNNFHWEESFWWVLAKTIGGKINGDAFEALSRSIPLNLLSKHKSSIHQLEALLFGQAALLDGDFSDEYPKLLQREYNFLKKKYNLVPSPLPVLFHRMRPGGFPTIRLAQLAMLVHTASHLFSKLLEAVDVAEVQSLFAVTANDFWHYHYTFDQPSGFKEKTLGDDAVAGIIINAVVPVLFAYGLHHNEENCKAKALRWLEEISPEVNSITKEFTALGLYNRSAYDSQALLELKNEYCCKKKCLDCSVGAGLLREAAAHYERTSNFPAERL